MYVHGHVPLSDQMYEDAVRATRGWRELEWVALHYDEATLEQRARLDRVNAAISEREDWDDD